MNSLSYIYIASENTKDSLSFDTANTGDIFMHCIVLLVCIFGIIMGINMIKTKQYKDKFGRVHKGLCVQIEGVFVILVFLYMLVNLVF